MPATYHDPAKYLPPKFTRKYISKPQCTAMYTKGRRAGQRCTWYCVDGTVYCKKHGQFAGKTLAPEHKAAIRKGHADWWARVKAFEKEHPGFLREYMHGNGVVSRAYKERQKRQKALGLGSKLVPISVLAQTDDPDLIKAHKTYIREISSLPDIPDKPVEELTLPEQFILNRRKALDRTYEILCEPYKDKNGVVDTKIMSIVKDAAARMNSMGVKVDINALATKRMDKMADLLDRLKNGDGAKVIEG